MVRTISARLALLTIGAAALALLIAGFAAIFLIRASNATSDIVTENLSVAVGLSAQQARLMEVHSAFLRLLVSQAANANPDIDKTGARLKNDVKDIALRLAAMKPGLSKEGQSEIDKIVAGLDTYNGTIEVVSSMLGLDFASATGMLPPFEQNYAKLLESFRVTVQRETEAATAQAGSVASGVRNSIIFLIALAILAAAGAILVSVRVSGGIKSAIASIADATRRLASDDLAVDPQALRRNDELDAIVAGLVVFRDNILRVRDLTARQEAARQEEERLRASQELREHEALEERRAMLLKLADNFDREVRDSIRACVAAVRSLSDNAGELSRRMATTLTASESSDETGKSVAANVASVAAAIEEFAAATKEISQQASGSARRIQDTVATADGAQSSVQGLGAATNEIGAIVTLIAAVAGKTDLLALNATIEAARAGDAGKGFAVVASEVKGLANQTGRATDDIRRQIEAVQGLSSQSTQRMAQVTGSIASLQEVVASIAAAVEEQDSAINEIVRAVSLAQDGVSTMTAQVGIARGEVTASGTTAADVSKTTKDLEARLSRLEHQAHGFTAQLRDDAKA